LSGKPGNIRKLTKVREISELLWKKLCRENGLFFHFLTTPVFSSINSLDGVFLLYTVLQYYTFTVIAVKFCSYTSSVRDMGNHNKRKSAEKSRGNFGGRTVPGDWLIGYSET